MQYTPQLPTSLDKPSPFTVWNNITHHILIHCFRLLTGSQKEQGTLIVPDGEKCYVSNVPSTPVEFVVNSNERKQEVLAE